MARRRLIGWYGSTPRPTTWRRIQVDDEHQVPEGLNGGPLTVDATIAKVVGQSEGALQRSAELVFDDLQSFAHLAQVGRGELRQSGWRRTNSASMGGATSTPLILRPSIGPEISALMKRPSIFAPTKLALRIDAPANETMSNATPSNSWVLLIALCSATVCPFVPRPVGPRTVNPRSQRTPTRVRRGEVVGAVDDWVGTEIAVVESFATRAGLW